MVLDGADAATERDADDHRQLHRATGAVVQLAHLTDDLVEGRVDEAVELDLDDRAVAAHRETDGRTDDAGLGQRWVDDALAELALEAVGEAEDAAEVTDVLTDDDDLVVGHHRVVHRRVETAGERELRRLLGANGSLLSGLRRAHALASSKDARYSANSSRCARSCGSRSM